MVMEIPTTKVVALVLAMTGTLCTGGVGYVIHQENRLSTVETKVDAQKEKIDETNEMIRELYKHLLNKKPPG